MNFLKDLLSKQRYPVILLLVGLVLIFFANYSISGYLSKPEVAKVSPSISLMSLGILCMLVSSLISLADEDALAFGETCKIRNTPSGFETTLGGLRISVDFGLFQKLYKDGDPGTAVVLPANEFYDDRCFNDERTVAGSFIRSHFSMPQAALLKGAVEQKLSSHPSKMVEREGGKLEKSYGVGSCVYLEQPLGTSHRIILAAVSTDRPRQGLRTDLGTIFKTIEEIRCIVADNRLSIVYIPLLGAGKGGVPPEVGFLTLASAILEARSREGGHHLQQVHLVIYQPEGGHPIIPQHRAKRALRQLVSLYIKASK